jgi:uncharacterized protein (DUF433 family)
MRFGRPHIRGISTDAIAGMVVAGESFETVADEYGLSRREVILACWYEGDQGSYRKRWRQWADQVYYLLAKDDVDLSGVEEPA